MRQKYGDKWNRQESSKLNAGWRGELAKHRELLTQAAQTDKGLKERFNSQESLFNHLSSSPDELRRYVMSTESQGSAAPETGGSSSQKRALKALCDQIDAMKKERTDLQKQLEETPIPENLSVFPHVS